MTTPKTVREICVRFYGPGDASRDHWFDLDDFGDWQEFSEHLQEYRWEGREYEVVDFSNLGLSYHGHDLQDLWEAYELIDEDPIAEYLLSYHDNVEYARNALENGYSVWDSKRDWADDYAEECLELKGVALQYFDSESFARDAELGGDVCFVPCPDGVIVCHS